MAQELFADANKKASHSNLNEIQSVASMYCEDMGKKFLLWTLLVVIWLLAGASFVAAILHGAGSLWAIRIGGATLLLFLAATCACLLQIKFEVDQIMLYRLIANADQLFAASDYSGALKSYINVMKRPIPRRSKIHVLEKLGIIYEQSGDLPGVADVQHRLTALNTAKY